MGCGDAKIARSVRNQVYSYDVVSLNKHVTTCDMANVSYKLSDTVSFVILHYKNGCYLAYTLYASNQDPSGRESCNHVITKEVTKSSNRCVTQLCSINS